MDSITHIALGAAIGEAHLGPRVGYRAAVWGAAVSTLPDLDVLLYPFLDSAQQLQLHRGLTHSILFLFLASPLLGVIIDRFHRSEGTGWKDWALLSFMALLSHMITDLPTSYGTQILEPFSSVRVTLDSIFIIDPIFTAPLISAVVLALTLNRDSRLRYWASRAGLVVSALYLLATLGIKTHVSNVYTHSFREQYGEFERLKTIPGPFTSLLWTGYVQRNDSLYAGTYSLFDKDEKIHFQGVPRNSGLIRPWQDDLPVEVLIWFSMGYYHVEEMNGEILVHDLRFGRNDLWMTDEKDFIWTNRLIFNEDRSRVIDFDRAIPILDTELDHHRLIWQRFWGIEQPDPDARPGPAIRRRWLGAAADTTLR